MLQSYRAPTTLEVIFILNASDNPFIEWFRICCQEALSYKVVGG